MATASAVAFVVFSCKGNLSEAEKLDLNKIPIQVVDSMFFVQSENGRVKMRVESPRMEVYERDTLSYDLFPKGIHVFGYNEDGLLETTIDAEQARHDKTPDGARDKWSAYGNVVVHNAIKNETMKTDTLYWTARRMRFGQTATFSCILLPVPCRGMACVRTKWRATLSSSIPSTTSLSWAATLRKLLWIR